MIVRTADPSDAPALARVHIDTWRATYKGLIAEEVLDRLDYRRSEDGWREDLSRPQVSAEQDTAAGPRRQGKRVVLVAEDEKAGVVGFASGGPNHDQDGCFDAEIYAIYILPEYQKRGVGRMLVAAMAKTFLETGFRSMVVWVLSQNPYRRFYEKLGGALVSERKITIGGGQYDVTSYGWTDLLGLVEALAREQLLDSQNRDCESNSCSRKGETPAESGRCDYPV